MEEQFEAYVVARKAALLRTAYLLCGDHAQAEDAVQNVLARVHLAWPRLERRDTVDGYVRRALVNEVRERWRRPWVRREQSVAEVPDGPVEQPLPEVDVAPAMWAALQRLSAKQRAVLVLRYYEDLSEAQIAEVLRIAPGTVKSQASRALATLREVVALDPVLGRPEGDHPEGDHP